jgi:hypothetical protein
LLQQAFAEEQASLLQWSAFVEQQVSAFAALEQGLGQLPSLLVQVLDCCLLPQPSELEPHGLLQGAWFLAAGSAAAVQAPRDGHPQAGHGPDSDAAPCTSTTTASVGSESQSLQQPSTSPSPQHASALVQVPFLSDAQQQLETVVVLLHLPESQQAADLAAGLVAAVVVEPLPQVPPSGEKWPLLEEAPTDFNEWQAFPLLQQSPAEEADLVGLGPQHSDSLSVFVLLQQAELSSCCLIEASLHDLSPTPQAIPAVNFSVQGAPVVCIKPCCEVSFVAMASLTQQESLPQFASDVCTTQTWNPRKQESRNIITFSMTWRSHSPKKSRLHGYKQRRKTNHVVAISGEQWKFPVHFGYYTAKFGDL